MRKFNDLFMQIATRTEISVVWNDFLSYTIQRLSGSEIELLYQYTKRELQLLEHLFNYWKELTQRLIEEHGYYDFCGVFYEEYILATEKSSNKGQFFTPQIICDLLTYTCPTDKKVVYDPACGSGRMGLSYYQVNPNFQFIGEDLDETACKMTVLNMYSHMINGSVNWINTLTREHHCTWIIEDELIHVSDEPTPLEYDLCLANPPYGVKWEGTRDMLKDKRFHEYGVLAPKSKGDYAFIQHSLYYLTDKGQACIVLPHGVLFRGQKEGVIREYIINHNWLDSIIGLPSNLFEGTSIPVALLIFKKGRVKKDVFFIDASKLYEKDRKTNYMTRDHVDKIVDTYLLRENVDKFSFVANLEYIQDNGYNCNIPRYVDTFEEEEEVDIKKLIQDMEWNCDEQIKINHQLKDYFSELEMQTTQFDKEIKRLEDTKETVLTEAKTIVQTSLDSFMGL
jgi:type I restriction enzyme M protein